MRPTLDDLCVMPSNLTPRDGRGISLLCRLRGGLISELKVPSTSQGTLGWLPILLKSWGLIRWCSQRPLSPRLRLALSIGIALLSPSTTQHCSDFRLPGLWTVLQPCLHPPQPLSEPRLPPWIPVQ